jgi:hypothetical protein
MTVTNEQLEQRIMEIRQSLGAWHAEYVGHLKVLTDTYVARSSAYNSSNNTVDIDKLMILMDRFKETVNARIDEQNARMEKLDREMRKMLEATYKGIVKLVGNRLKTKSAT